MKTQVTRTRESREFMRSRTPIWADKKEIAKIYRQSKEWGRNYHVDHIVPLCHPYVCGLHCEANLQIIRADLNQQKSNNWWDQQWHEQEYIDLPEFLRVYQYELPL